MMMMIIIIVVAIVVAMIIMVMIIMIAIKLIIIMMMMVINTTSKDAVRDFLFYHLLSAPETVSSMHAHVAKAQSHMCKSPATHLVFVTFNMCATYCEGTAQLRTLLINNLRIIVAFTGAMLGFLDI